MSDYIKREDAIFVALQQPLYSVVSQIKQLDGIDIVKCKECRHSEYREDYDDYLCDEDGISVHEADWYCADGERKE